MMRDISSIVQVFSHETTDLLDERYSQLWISCDSICACCLIMCYASWHALSSVAPCLGSWRHWSLAFTQWRISFASASSRSLKVGKVEANKRGMQHGSGLHAVCCPHEPPLVPPRVPPARAVGGVGGQWPTAAVDGMLAQLPFRPGLRLCSPYN
jgi:hypothetical protein